MLKNIIKLNTARNCLRYIIKLYGIKEMYIPYYICPVIKSVLKFEGVKVKFYHIDKKFMPCFEFRESDFILYPNYFGICSDNVILLEKKYKNLIVDNAHSFYSKKMGLCSFNSVRKFFQPRFGIREGAYLYSDCKSDYKFNVSENYKICEYTFENIVKNENRLDREDIKIISDTSESILKKINFEEEKERRLKNFEKYHERYSSLNRLNIRLKDGEIPFVYPLLSKDENIGFELEKQGLMIFRYWNELPKTFIEYEFYKYLIPIPIY